MTTPKPCTMPEEFDMGLFYCMSEYFYSVIDTDTQEPPLKRARYVRADLVEKMKDRL